MINVYDKFALSQSDATISVAYNSYCHLFLMTSFMKRGPEGFLLLYFTTELTPFWL